jgi:hypothetical protein
MSCFIIRRATLGEGVEVHVMYRTYLVLCDFNTDLPIKGNNLLKSQIIGKQQCGFRKSTPLIKTPSKQDRNYSEEEKREQLLPFPNLLGYIPLSIELSLEYSNNIVKKCQLTSR